MNPTHCPGRFLRMLVMTALAVVVGCDSREGSAPAGRVVFTVPQGATFGEITDTLTTRGLVDHPRMFGMYARIRGLDTEIRSGEYAVPAGRPWGARGRRRHRGGLGDGSGRVRRIGRLAATGRGDDGDRCCEHRPLAHRSKR